MASESEDDEYIIDYLDDPQEMTLVELDSKDVEHGPKRKKKFVPNFDIPGVVSVALDDSTQANLKIKIGEDVSGEFPWKTVKKELILDNVTVLQEKSTFARYKAEIELYEEDEMLLGYILDETKDSDEFYFCLTIDSKRHCEVQAARILKRQIKKLNQSVHRTIKPWTSLGSEQEVDDFDVKNSRPLIKIEIKSKYPRDVSRFSFRTTDHVRDGYLDLLPNKEFEIVTRQRIDVAVQAIPVKKSSEAQTEMKFPQNVWTQCSTEDVEIPEVKEKDEPTVGKKVKKSSVDKDNTLEENLLKVLPQVLNMVKFNSVLDIYNIDYPALVGDNDEFGDIQDFYFDERLFFIDVSAKDKLVSSVTWHPTLTGVMAVSYADNTMAIVKPKDQIDQVYRDVYNQNLVLIWSLTDSISPKLYLESHREVRTVSFCPYEKGLLVGGCVNGQVIVWDLGDKLKIDEEIEEVTMVQTKFRNMARKEMNWMRDVNGKQFMRPVILTDLANGHKASVTDITWLSSRCEMVNCRKINCKCSLQFLTISLDGNLLIWSLDVPENAQIKTKIETSRGDVALEELGLNVSKYQALDKVLKPKYRIIVGEQGASSRMALTTVSLRRRPQEKEDGKKIECVWLGSLYGEFCKISWFTEEQVLDQDTLYCEFIFKTSLHDGPISCCARNPFCEELIATVGGKIFAVWSERLMEKPLFWRKTDYFMTHAAWSPYIPGQIFVTTQEGNIDIWDFLQRSESPTKTRRICGDILTGVYVQKLDLANEKVMAVADSAGSLRIFDLSDSLTQNDETKLEQTETYFRRELEAVEQFDDWEKKWFEKHAAEIDKRQKEAEALLKENEKKARLKARKDRERREIEEERKAKEKKAVKVVDHAEKYRENEWRHAVKVIQKIKRLDKATLMKLEKPLRDLEALKRSVAEKQAKALKRQQAVFDETVAILFPELDSRNDELAEVRVAEDKEARRAEILREYEDIAEKARQFVRDNPYDREFSWEETLNRAKGTRKSLQVAKASPPVVKESARVKTVDEVKEERQIEMAEPAKTKKIVITEPAEVAGGRNASAGRNVSSGRKKLFPSGKEKDNQKAI